MTTPLFRDKITEIFVSVDDFCLELKKPVNQLQLEQGADTMKKRNRKATLSESEIISVLIGFHTGGFKNLKSFYLNYVCVHLQDCFPEVVSTIGSLS